MPITEREFLLEEWKDIRETLRYFGNKRFAQMTVFLAITGIMMTAFFTPSFISYRIIFQILGPVLSLIFFLLEYRSEEYLRKFIKLGEQIENSVYRILPAAKLEMMHRRPVLRRNHRWRKGSNLTFFLYGIIFICWGLSFIWFHPEIADSQLSHPANSNCYQVSIDVHMNSNYIHEQPKEPPSKQTKLKEIHEKHAKSCKAGNDGKR